MAKPDAPKGATWLLRLIEDLGIQYDQAVPLYNDNNGCGVSVGLGGNPVHHRWSKHISLQQHFI